MASHTTIPYSSSTEPQILEVSPAEPTMIVSPPQPNLQVERPQKYKCNFCKFNCSSRYGLSGHYNKHKSDKSLIEWILYGPPNSKIRKAIIKTAEEGEIYEFKRRTWTKTRAPKTQVQARKCVLSPEPIGAIFPTNSLQQSRYTLNITNNLEGDHNESSKIVDAPPGFLAHNKSEVTSFQGLNGLTMPDFRGADQIQDRNQICKVTALSRRFQEAVPMGMAHITKGQCLPTNFGVGSSSNTIPVPLFQKFTMPMIKVEEPRDIMLRKDFGH